MTGDEGESELEAFNEKIERQHFQGQWKAIANEGEGLELDPHVWKWDDIRAVLDEARDVVSLEDHPQGARRSIGLRNPAYSTGNQTSRTMNVGIQMVQPDEVARAHRHSITAFRFIIEGGDGAHTNVEGEEFPMADGDLILTPRMTWHDHVNRSDEPVIWLDGLDVPLVRSLGAAEFENYRSDRQTRQVPKGFSQSRFGLLRPESDGHDEVTEDAPPYRFPWSDTYDALMAAAEQGADYDPFNGVRLEYVNPRRGDGPVLQSLALFIQLCPAGEATAEHKHNSTEIYHVVSGSGDTLIDGDAYEWSAGDCFIVPPDRWHAHRADDEETILFCVSDRPVFESFGLHSAEAREEVSTSEADADATVPQHA